MTEVFKLGVVVSAQDFISSKLQKISDEWDDLKKRFEGVDGIEKAMNRISAAASNLKTGMAIASTGLLLLKALPLDEARSFEKELGLLQATSNATAKEFIELKEAAIQAGMKTQFSPDQAAAGLTALASAGMNAKQSIKALLPVLDLASASAGKLSIDNAAADVAATLNTFRRSAVDVTDTFTTMANISSFSIHDLGSAWRGVNAIASSMNQEMETTALMLSAVKRAGFTTAESGEKVRMALEALSSPSQTAKEAMQKLGVETYDSTGKFRSLIDIMDDMKKKFEEKNYSEAKRNEALSKILLSGGSSAYRALMGLSEEERKDWLNKLNSKQGATKKFAKTQQETYEGISVTLEGVLSTFKVVFGDALLPVMKTLKSALLSVLSPMVEFFKEHPGLTQLIVGFTAFAGVASVLIGSIKSLIAIKSIFIAVSALAVNAQFMEAASGTTLGGTMSFLKMQYMGNIVAMYGSISARMGETFAIKAATLARTISIGVLGLERTSVATSTVLYGVLTGKVKLATAAQWLWNTAIAANPIAFVVISVVALGVAIYGLIKYYDAWASKVQALYKENKILVSIVTFVLGPIVWILVSIALNAEKVKNAFLKIGEALGLAKSKVDKFHETQMSSLDSEKTALEKKLEQLQKQEQMYASLGDMGTEAYNSVQAKIVETKRKLEDLNDALQTSDGMLAQFIKTKESLEKQLETSEMKLKVAEESKDLVAIKRAKEEYDKLKGSISDINEEIQKQKDLPGSLQSIVTELDKLRTAKAEIDMSEPNLKGTAGYKKIEEQIKKAEDSLATLEVRLAQTASVSGQEFVKTFAEGMDKEFINLYKKVSSNNSVIMDFFNKSDAKRGPFSRVSHAGRSFLSTWANGFESGKSRLFTVIDSTLSKARDAFDIQAGLGQIDFKLDSPVSMEKVLKSGEAIVKTLAQGVKNSANTLYDAIKNVFQKSWKLFTQSDAKEGPFSKMTYSGKSLVRTFSDGTESEAPKLYSTVEKTFGNANEIIQKENTIERSIPSQNQKTVSSQNSNVLNFEYFIKEFNISGNSSESDFSFARMMEAAIYDELKKREAYT